MPKFIDLTGQRFGRLLVLERAPNRGKRTFWRCICECGNIKDISAKLLRRQETQSCGCLNREISTKHGLCREHIKMYKSWQTIKERCYNPNNISYKNYGARGIAMSNEWRHDFGAFFNDMGPKPGPEYTLERRDNNGNYEKSNCYWATRKVQARNRRDNNFLTYDGKTQCMTDWANDLGISVTAIKYRLKKGWSVEKALTTPPDINFIRNSRSPTA